MRFNSPEHLAEWVSTGKYPAIHDAMFAAATSCLEGSRILDLGCSYGLLGFRVAEKLSAAMLVGVEMNEAVIAAGTAAKLGGAMQGMAYRKLRVTAATLLQLIDIIGEFEIDVVIARRILPELFDRDLELGKRFAAMVKMAGVKEMLVEGRVFSARSTSALASIDQEVAMLSGSYTEQKRIKAVSYLRAR